MTEVRVDLIKLTQLVRMRATDALLADPELFASARDSDRLFDELLRKAQSRGAEAGTPGSEVAAQSPDAGAQPGSSNRTGSAAERSSKAEPSDSAGTKQEAQSPQSPQSAQSTDEGAAVSEQTESNESDQATKTNPDSTAADGADGDSQASHTRQRAPAAQDPKAKLQETAAEQERVVSEQPEGHLRSEALAQAAEQGDKSQRESDETQKTEKPLGPPKPTAVPEGQSANSEATSALAEQQPEEHSQKQSHPHAQATQKAADGLLGAGREATAEGTLAENPGQSASETSAEKGSRGQQTRSTHTQGTPAPAAAAPEQPPSAVQSPASSGPAVNVAAVQNQQAAQSASASQPTSSPAPQPTGGEGQGRADMVGTTVRFGGARAVRSTGKPAPGAPEGDTPAVDRVRFVQRVARAFQALGQRRGTVRLRLHPPELGSLRLEVTVERGVLTARLETETHQARNLLLDNLPALRQRLAQQDIRIQQFHVDLMQQPPGGTPDRMPEGFGTGGRAHRGHSSAGQASGPEEPAGAEPPGVSRPGEGTRLNVVI